MIMKRLPWRGKMALQIIMCISAVMAVSLRFWVKRDHRRTPQLLIVDALVTSSALLGLVAAVLFTVEDRAILNWEEHPTPLPEHPLLQDWTHLLHWIEGFIYFTVEWNTKGAVLTLYFELFPVTIISKRWVRWGMWAVMVYCIAAYILNMSLLINHCRPISRNWKDPTCDPLRNRTLATILYATNVSTDILIMCILSCLIRINTWSKQTISGLAILFMVGSMTIVGSTMRFGVTYTSFPSESMADVDPAKFDADVTGLSNIEIFGLVDGWSSIIAICLPSFRRYLRMPSRSSPRNSGLVAVDASDVVECSNSSASGRRRKLPVEMDTLSDSESLVDPKADRDGERESPVHGEESAIYSMP